MDEEGKKLEAVGDGLLLACARLYLRDRHRDISYSLYTRLITRMVSNRTLAEIAQAERIHTGQDGAADAFEREITTRYYRQGFRDTKRWLWKLFDKHLDIEEEARKMIDPTQTDRLTRIVRGTLRGALKMQGERVKETSIEAATKQIVSHLKSSDQL